METNCILCEYHVARRAALLTVCFVNILHVTFVVVFARIVMQSVVHCVNIAFGSYSVAEHWQHGCVQRDSLPTGGQHRTMPIYSVAL